jgi:hypothetical protein
VKNIAATLLLLLLSSGIASAGETREIDLTDGSVITGEVLSLANGIYTIRTESLGTLSVSEARIRSIRSRGSVEPAASRPSTRDISSLTEKMLSNDQIMGIIQSLKDDPDFQKALEDPAIVNAVKSGDASALMANPEFLKLLNNAKVKEIQEKVSK